MATLIPNHPRVPSGRGGDCRCFGRFCAVARARWPDQLRRPTAALSREVLHIDFAGVSEFLLPMKREVGPPMKRENPTPGLDFSGLSAQ